MSVVATMGRANEQGFIEMKMEPASAVLQVSK
jgi:hypothetical protein